MGNAARFEDQSGNQLDTGDYRFAGDERKMGVALGAADAW